jgi:hypothetical protein
MNKNIFNIRKIAGLSLLTLLLSGSSLPSFANGDKEKNGPAGNTGASTAEVKYISGQDGEYLFNVVYNNAAGSRFTLIVLDADGNQLFQSQYSDKKFDKKFRLADPEDFGKLTFVIRNFGDNSVQRFEVNTNNRLVEDIEVKEVK